MKAQKKVTSTVFLCILFTIVYILFAAIPDDPKLKIKPVWTTSLNSRAEPSAASENAIPFKLGQILGYIEPEGTISLRETFPYMASISSKNWCIYGADAENTAFYTPDGTKAGTIKEAGFPYITENGIFLFQPGGMSFDRIDGGGNSLWRYEETSPITAFNTSKNGIIAGFASGKLVKFGMDGKIESVIFPGGSDIQVILGAAVSNSGIYSACISGIDNQRFVLYRTTANQTKTIFHEYLGKGLREQVFVQFSKDEKHVFFYEKGGLVIVNTEKLESHHTKLDGKLITVAEEENSNCFYVLSKNGTTYIVSIYEYPASKIGSFSFKADKASIYLKDNCFYVGRNDEITKLEIEK